MNKIKNLQELLTVKKDFSERLAIRHVREKISSESATDMKRDIMVCASTGCLSASSDKIVEALRTSLKSHGLEEKVSVHITGCFGFCEKGPVVKIAPDNVFYIHVKPDDAEEIVVSHLIGGNPLERLLFLEPSSGKIIHKQEEMGFYKKQLRIALRNCGIINPESIGEYIGSGGYEMSCRCLTEKTPWEIIDVIKKSELRGRGGGGFPTGLKWETTAAEPGDKKYVICNADEGDPGAFMDRSILEGDPHSVLEAMTIAGYAMGADTGYVYIRAEYPLAIQRLKTAIAQAEEAGLLGRNIFGSSFSFKIEIRLGAGAFVCGEETALIASIEGKRGEPSIKPPFPSQSGLWGKPTSVNNVETFANIPVILQKGPEWFCSIGTETSKGTKVFALAGCIKNVGLVEVPMGTTLHEIIFEIGGGILNDREFKAVQTGGPSGGCIPSQFLDTPIDYESLKKIGSMMGSGGMIVLDESTCMVDLAKFYMEFTVDESCGKCTPCRIGNKRLLEMLQKITSGNGTEEDLKKMKELGQIIKDTSLCGLGQSAPNPVLSTMKYFPEEYEAHVKEKRCPAGVCTDLLRYNITDKCIGCGICAKVCPVKCITGTPREKHVIDQDKCIRCGTCYEKCPVQAIIRE